MLLRRVHSLFARRSSTLCTPIDPILEPIRLKSDFKTTGGENRFCPWVFRGDHRAPAAIKKMGGFFPGNNNPSLVHHITKGLKVSWSGKVLYPLEYTDSGYVSASHYYQIARKFADNAGGKYRTVYRIIMPSIKANYFVNYGAASSKIISETAIRNEAEASATDMIPYTDVAATKSCADRLSSWDRNPDFDDKGRDFSLTVLSKSEAEAAEFAKFHPNLVFPSYKTAIEIVKELKELSATYKPSDYMVCFEGIQVSTVEHILKKSLLNPTPADLHSYYLEHYHLIQKKMSSEKYRLTIFGINGGKTKTADDKAPKNNSFKLGT